MQSEYIPSGAANGLSQVEVLLIAGESMQKHHGRMSTCSTRQIKQGIHSRTVTGYEHFRRAGWMRWIWLWVTDHRGRNRLTQVGSGRYARQREQQSYAKPYLH